ncbi:MAG: hypothetical protein EA369_03505 [Bradymonadales bacterium]|nr:MAG: hypothetical protein EA369_03505 [Bradymonadales bacterium]
MFHTGYSILVLSMLLAWSSLLLGLSLFSLRSPLAFAQWVGPYFWLKNRFSWTEKTDRRFSYASGLLLLAGMASSKFILGGVFVTAAFRLWASPFAFLFQP